MPRRTGPACEGVRSHIIYDSRAGRVAKLDSYVLDGYARAAFDAIAAYVKGERVEPPKDAGTHSQLAL